MKDKYCGKKERGGLFIVIELNLPASQEKQRIKRQQQNKKIELSDLKSGGVFIKNKTFLLSELYDKQKR